MYVTLFTEFSFAKRCQEHAHRIPCKLDEPHLALAASRLNWNLISSQRTPISPLAVLVPGRNRDSDSLLALPLTSFRLENTKQHNRRSKQVQFKTSAGIGVHPRLIKAWLSQHRPKVGTVIPYIICYNVVARHRLRPFFEILR
jgi:hypothetical protein